ncbi:MAG: amino acid adenylation domain-containing protein [Pseudomonadales bacterium]
MLPLTREQEGLWVEWRLSPLGVSYNTCIQMKLAGPLDGLRFERAIAAVVAHFELLRAYCVEVDGVPRFALSTRAYQLERIDLSDGQLPEDSVRFRKAMAILARRRDAAIDLTEFPLIRAALVQTDPGTHYFIGVVPHIISDGFAALSILKAISIAYNDGPGALAAAHGEARVDWSDYVALRARQSADARLAAREHWQGVLAGAQHIVPLGNHTRGQSAIADTRGCRYFFSFEVDRLRRFNRLARSRRTSLFAVLAALYATLLYRFTSQTDLVIVFPVNVRPPGYRDAFGLFVNLIPLRVDLSGNPSFGDLVEQIGRRRREDKRHQHLPGLDIVRAKRELVRDFDGRLSNVSMAQTVSRFEGLDLPGVACSALDNDAIHVRDDLSLMYELSEERVGLWLEYRESAFTPAEIATMADALLRVAEAADRDANVPIAAIDLIDEPQRRALLATGRGPAMTVDADDYAALFLRSATRHGDVSALRYGDTTLSYRSLEALSAALAFRLAAMPGPVALIVDRSIEQIVVMLAALRAGVPYVPLATGQGRERLGAMLRELQPAWLVCGLDVYQELRDESLASHLDPADIAADIAAATAADTAAASGATTLPRIDPAAPAYVIYTSGSTGRPKGVQVSHSALVNRITWLTRMFPLGAGERVLQNTSYAFDVSVAEIFWPLAMGATLVLANAKAARDPRYLRQLIHRNRITTALFVPSALQPLLQEPSETATLATLERVLCAGEPLPLALARSCLQITGARVFNLYGPTEATIYATWKELTLQDEAVSIGRPLANTQAAVVNDALRLQPPGVVGELCLAGPGLARGYLAQPALTEERFPEGVIDAGRWYRTGDRVLMNADGEIFYVGRTDRQIKLRGHRIELGEIEHVLRSLPGVTDAVVVPGGAREHGEPRTLAAIVADGGAFDTSGPPPGHPLTAANWRETVGRFLPDYMVPNSLQWIDALPRLPSGKVDLRRLPALQAPPATSGERPSTPTERAMARVWAEVLDLPITRVRLNSNFFELGGDSLMLIALASKLEAEGLYIGVHELFANPTIAASLPRATTARRTLISQAPVLGDFPLLPRHHKFFADDFAHPAHWNRSFVLHFDRPLDAQALQQSLNAVMRHHDGLRSSFHQHAGVRYFRVAPEMGVEVPLQRHDLTHLPLGQRQEQLLERINDANANLSLEAAPLLRALLFDEESGCTVALVLHHLLIDMRSCQILLEDLLGAYQASIAHQPVRLLPKTTSTGEWSARLHDLVDSSWQVDEVAHWEAQLQQVGHPIPADYAPTVPARDGDQRVLEVELSTLETEALTREFCVRAGLGVHQVLLAAFAEAFRGWSASPWLAVNTCGIGRDAPIEGVDLSRTVGELNTVFPLALNLEGQEPLDEVRSAFRALPYLGAHYGMLRYLAKHEALQRPEPEVFFNYVSRIGETIDEALGVTVEMAPAAVRSTHPENRNCYALYLEALVHHGRLSLHLGYDSARFSAATAQGLLQSWRRVVADYLMIDSHAGRDLPRV